MKVLWLHHFEDYWNHSLKEFDTNFEKELLKVMNYLEHEEFNKVLITRFMENKEGDCHLPLINFCNSKNIRIEFKEYGYGFRNDNNEYKKKDYGKEWIYGNRQEHTEKDVLPIEEFQKELKNHEVYLGGAFENECLNDVESIMKHLEINYIKINELCVGTYAQYSFFTTPNEKVINFLTENQIYKNSIEKEYEKDPIYILQKEKKLKELLADTDNTLLSYLELSYNIGEFDISENTYQYIYELIESNIEIADRNIPEEYIENIINNIEEDFNLYGYEEVEDLIIDNPELYKEIIESLKSRIEEEMENFNNLSNNEISVEDFKSVSSHLFSQLLDNINKDSDLLIHIVNKKTNVSLNGTYYHGTYFQIENINDIEENIFLELDLNCTNLNANYVTDEILDAEWFVDYHRNKNEGIPVIFEIDIDMKKIYKIDIQKENIIINGNEYSITGDRELYFEELKSKGYEGCLIENNYNNGGHDIAIFEDLRTNRIKLMLNNKWTDFMVLEEVEDFLRKNIENKRKSKLSL